MFQCRVPKPKPCQTVRYSSWLSTIAVPRTPASALMISADYRRRGGRQVTDDRMRVVVQQVLAAVFPVALALLAGGTC
jgi:hypothetical protein